MLLEDFFVTEVGQHINVNEVEIPYEKWQRISVELNSLGPPKNAGEWRSVRPRC